ncbi:MAG: hypothetical protein HOP30_22150 [Cyclobacteriaceae bacterium]|nr:hypothetical protein [Cyclobacteriaceae bacterium]
MPAQSREQLKKYFRNGALVREEYFNDLIDSTVNKVSDKVEPTSDSGLGLTPSVNGNRYLSFFKDSISEKNNIPTFAWHALGAQQETLSMGTPGATKDQLKSVVAFKSFADKGNSVRIGINNVNPVYDLDVNGSVGIRARIGCYRDPAIDYNQVKADGQWHKILTNQRGIQAFEIILQASEPDGKYAMFYAVLTIAKASNKTVTAISQDYKWWWQRLQMRCVVEKEGVSGIEVRTAMKYAGAPIIQSRITRLWN